MCDCIKTIEGKVLDHLKESRRFKKPIVSVRMRGKIFSLGEQLELKISSEFEIELEGQKKKPTMPVTWSHCAFCGEKLNA